MVEKRGRCQGSKTQAGSETTDGLTRENEGEQELKERGRAVSSRPEGVLKKSQEYGFESECQ